MSEKIRRLGPPYFYREALSIAIPVMLQQLIMSMVSLIDNFMVAGLGDVSMAAVNVSNHIVFIFFVMVNAVCGAGGIYLAQFRGANDSEGMKHAYRFKALLSLSAAVFFFVLFWVIPAQMLALLTAGNVAQAEIIPSGITYLRLVSFTLVSAAISSTIGSSFREIGKPKVPLIISICATLINTAGNWLLIYGNLGAPRLEITGAAIATIAARTFEAAAFIIYANRKKIAFYCPFRLLLNVDWVLVRKILSKSLMMFISESSFDVSETVMLALYNGRGGAETVAGMAAGWTIANVFFLLFGGIWTTSSVLVGGSLGAGKLDEARRRGRWLMTGAIIAGTVIALVGALLSTLLVPIVYVNLTAAARRIGLGLVLVILAYFPLWSGLNAQFAICRSGGDTLMGIYADALINYIVVIPLAFILARLTPIGPVGIFTVLKLTDIGKYFIARHFYKTERWVKNLALENSRYS
jgi:Na+-driven multidrug efflux pump